MAWNYFRPKIKWHREVSHEDPKVVEQYRACNRTLKEERERYDELVNENLPVHLHRGDQSSSNRLLGYTDAMMATCGTFLVLPLRNLSELEEGETLREFTNKNGIEFVIFFFGFLIICTTWEWINVRSIVIKRLDDILVLLSILQMMFIAVLPFSMALAGHYPSEEVTILATTVILILINIVDLLIIFYAFATPQLLHCRVTMWPVEDQKNFECLCL